MAAKRLDPNPLEIIEKVYDRRSLAYRILVAHGNLVAKKAMKIAQRVSHLNPDVLFIEQAAMLHDICLLYTSDAADDDYTV